MRKIKERMGKEQWDTNLTSRQGPGSSRNISWILLAVTLFLFFFIVYSGPLAAGEADVVNVQVRKSGNSTYSFSVTVRHQDTGWKHYCNKWDVVGSDGKLYGTRVLHHPHENEQPFTRSMSGVKIPQHIKSVTIRAHDLVHKYGGKVMTVNLPR